ncbi:hypothetical protein B0H11DRAFT_2208396, partial [Mycena galericulata]
MHSPPTRIMIENFFFFHPVVQFMADSSSHLSAPAGRRKPVLSSSDPSSDPLSHANGLEPTANTALHPAPGAISNQKGLSSGQATGAPMPVHPSTPAPPLLNPAPGPASNLRSMTRTASAPAIIPGASSAPVGAVGAAVSLSATPPDSPVDAATKISTFEHFKMDTRPKPTTAKPLSDYAVANLAILADAVRVIETRGEENALAVASLTSEVRLRPRGRSASSPSMTWGGLYGVRLTGSQSPPPRERSRSRSKS